MPAWVGLVGGDFVAIVMFVVIGRASHAMSLLDVPGMLFVAAPFLIGWFVVAPWFGLYRVEIVAHRMQTLWRVSVAWLIGGGMGLVLRAFFLERSLTDPTSYPLTFTLITLATVLMLLLIWRMGYVWWVNREGQA